MIKRLAAWLICGLLIGWAFAGGAQAQAPAAKSSGPVFPEGVDQHVEPLLLTAGLPYIDKVMINGQPVGPFLLDTGANTTVIDPSVARQLGLRPIGTGSANKISGTTYSVSEIRIGGVVYQNLQVVAYDLSPISENMLRPTMGLIGGTILARQPFAVDLAERQFTLYRPGAFQGERGNPFKLSIINRLKGTAEELFPPSGQPVVDALIDGKIEARLMLDTGANTLTLESWFVRRNPELLGRGGYSTGGAKIGGREKSLVAVVKTVDAIGVACAPLSTVQATHVPPGANVEIENYDAIIGRCLLVGHCVVFDYAKGCVWAAPSTGSLAKLLKEGRLKPNERDLLGVTPLMLAASEGRASDVELLINQARVHTGLRRFGDVAAIHDAARHGRVDVLRLLLKKDPKSVDWKQADGLTPLMLAVNSRNPVAVHVLLEAGADVSLLDNQGASALHLAANKGNSSAIGSLVGAGANLEQKRSDGLTPLQVAVLFGGPREIESLIGAGARTDIVDADGYNLLHFIASRGDLEAVPVLVKSMPAGSVNAADNKGLVPLAYAANRSVKAIQYFLEAGADPRRIVSTNGRTFYHLAAILGAPELVPLIRQAAADIPINQKDQDDRVPLAYAIEKGDLATAQALLEVGADPQARFKGQSTVLDLARSGGNRPMYELLLKAVRDR